MAISRPPFSPLGSGRVGGYRIHKNQKTGNEPSFILKDRKFSFDPLFFVFCFGKSKKLTYYFGKWTGKYFFSRISVCNDICFLGIFFKSGLILNERWNKYLNFSQHGQGYCSVYSYVCISDSRKNAYLSQILTKYERRDYPHTHRCILPFT